jgi:hypothetical protein
MSLTRAQNFYPGLMLAVWLLLDVPFGAYAGNPDLRLDASLGAGVLDFDYEEFDLDGTSLDWEEGYLPGLNAGLQLRRDAWFAETALLAWSGRADYATPLVTSDTDEDILDWNAIAGHTLFAQADRRLSLYAGLGYRHWQRDIDSTPGANDGLDETYRWWYGSVGLRAESEVTGRVSFRADLQLRRTLDPSIDVHFRNGLDDVTLDLGEANGARAAFTLENRMDNDLILFVTPWFEYWKIGRSTEAVFPPVFEPRSRTHNLGVNAGVRWQLF